MKEVVLTEQEKADKQPAAGFSRRRFLGLAGGFAAAGTLLSSCEKEPEIGPGVNKDGSYRLGTGDIGILNYAYVLEQLEAAFYTQVIETPYSGITNGERTLLTDIRDHEIAHREFFKAILGDNAIPDLKFNLSGVIFSQRDSVIKSARNIEDLGVSAYNGAGSLLMSPDYLIALGKIASVEARHAAYLRERFETGTFADNAVVNMNGLDVSRNPIDVLRLAEEFIFTKIDARNLPTE